MKQNRIMAFVNWAPNIRTPAMINPHHREILQLILENSGKGTSQTFSDSYLGNKNPRYAITAPVLRRLAKEWMREHRTLTACDYAAVLDSLINGQSSTEKSFAGILMDYATTEQGAFSPAHFDKWLDQLEGWAEIDSVCTGAYTIKQIPLHWKIWKPLLIRFSKDKNISKRRASLVFFCSPLSHCDEADIANTALANIDRLKSEKDILITKAVSWLLRSMIKHHRKLVAGYMKTYAETLPKIAVRETLVKLKTGKKSGKK
jgi:3-methyladenine DNA glycosylase AlkD